MREWLRSGVLLVAGVLVVGLAGSPTYSQNRILRDYDVAIGVLKTGRHNAITDVKGVRVGHTTRVEGDAIRTGVTAIVPHNDNIFQEKVPAAIFVGNGFGKLAGYTQVRELGNIETPIVLTNTLSVPAATDALIDYTFSFPENKRSKKRQSRSWRDK
jgi:D-aminopeptidase